MGKEAIKKTRTLVANMGQGTAPNGMLLIDVPARTTTGSTVTIRDDQNTGNSANVGDVCKYVHLIIQAGNRDANVEAGDTGWIEWAVTFQKEILTTIPTTNTGVVTLGNIAQSME